LNESVIVAASSAILTPIGKEENKGEKLGVGTAKG